MAGGLLVKKDPKKNQLGDGFGSEVLKDSQSNFVAKPPLKFSLNGILGLNQTVELNKSSQKDKEFSFGINHLQQEQNILFNQHQQELIQTLKELRNEIAKLTNVTNNLEKDVQKVAIEEIIEANEYQISFFVRIRNFISNVLENISEARIWVEGFSAKKKKKNAFWNTARNKKKGGTQYMFSDEHSVARSVG